VNARRAAGIVALAAGALFVAAAVTSGPIATPGGNRWQGGPMGHGVGMMGHGAGMPMSGMGGMMGFGASGPASTPIPGAPEVRVTLGNFFLEPSVIRLPKNADVNLTVVNPASTAVAHDLTVPALGIHVVARAGESVTIGLRALPAGTYDAFCSVPGHIETGMRGSVVVE
jgi:heme/copper-type cytochrome/quinol oxidase subunit 2